MLCAAEGFSPHESAGCGKCYNRERPQHDICFSDPPAADEHLRPTTTFLYGGATKAITSDRKKFTVRREALIDRYRVRTLRRPSGAYPGKHIVVDTLSSLSARTILSDSGGREAFEHAQTPTVRIVPLSLENKLHAQRTPTNGVMVITGWSGTSLATR